MKILSLLFAFAIAMTTPAFAAKKGAEGKGKSAKHGLALKKLDKNSNKQIDGEEIASLKDAFAKAPDDSKLKKRLDHNGNGTLDDKEIERLNKRMAAGGGKDGKKGKKASGKKKGKKNAAQ